MASAYAVLRRLWRADVKREDYGWNAFKMKWLVPNYRRAVGPAYWAYCFREWWWYNMDPHNCCGLLHEVIEWKEQKLMKWLTPHLKHARDFLSFCVEENGTKLLWHGANFFRTRSRDENQWYFNGRASWLGKVTVTRSQWLDSKEEPQNLFVHGIAQGLSGEEPEEKLVEKREVVFSGWILTKKQEQRARDSITQQLEFDWDWLSIALEKLVEKLKIEDPQRAWEWKKRLEHAVLKEGWPEAAEWWCLSEEEYEKFEARICSMTAEEAEKLAGNGE